MESPLLQRRILEYLHNHEKNFPGSRVRISSLAGELKKSFKEICSAINILNQERYIFLYFIQDENGNLVDGEIGINRKGIQLVENRDEFNQKFALDASHIANFLKYLLNKDQ